MNRWINTRLGIMMFLQFFVWGGWYTTIAVYMSDRGMADLTHWPYTVNPVAAIVAPFFLGLVADRFFATEKILGGLHILGGIVILLTPQASSTPVVFILLLLLYNLCYMPTLGLVNTLTFSHIKNQEKQFPLIRVFGTIGWIAAGLCISFVLSRFVNGLPEQTPWPIYMTGISGILLGCYSFTLPHTPPPGAGESVSLRSILGIDALQALGSRSFYVFITCSLLLCIPLAAYYNFTQIFLTNTGFVNIAGTQTLGQMSEVVFMILMPFFFARLGIKWMLSVGMAAWGLRYIFFAMAAPDALFWMIITGILLHGVCYDFFFVAGQVYVDKKAVPAIRGQAQGFYVLATYGIGMLIGAQVAGAVYNSFLENAAALTPQQWQNFWFLPAGFALGILLLFNTLFKNNAA